MRAAHRLSIASFVTVTSLAGIVGLAALSACVREGAAVVAPVEVTIDNGDGGPAMPLVIAAPSLSTDRDRCTAVLRAATIKTNPGCSLDERLSHGNGTLLYPCAGDGPVEAIFAEHHFTGKIADSGITLALGTELDWEDGCHWETKQAIVGTWKRDATRKPKLSWSYSEARVSGTNCEIPCTATADIEVVPEDGRPSPSP